MPIEEALGCGRSPGEVVDLLGDVPPLERRVARSDGGNVAGYRLGFQAQPLQVLFLPRRRLLYHLPVPRLRHQSQVYLHPPLLCQLQDGLDGWRRGAGRADGIERRRVELGPLDDDLVQADGLEGVEEPLPPGAAPAVVFVDQLDEGPVYKRTLRIARRRQAAGRVEAVPGEGGGEPRG